MNVTLFRRWHLTGQSNEFETNIFTIIQTQKYKNAVEELRAKRHSLSDEEFERLRMALLPVYTGCCTCEGGHSYGSVRSLSGYIVMELKNVRNIPEVKKFLASLNFVAALWISCCGGNLLVAVPFTAPIEIYHEWWLSAEGFFKLMGYEVDPSSRNIKHTTFVSYDPDVYINKNAEDWFKIGAQHDGFVEPLK